MKEIDVKQTIAKMKHRLILLKQFQIEKEFEHCWAIQIEELQVEEEASDYLHYTKSIIDTRWNNQGVSYDAHLLDAIERKDRANVQRKHECMIAQAEAQYLLTGMQHLKPEERELLEDVYIHRRSIHSLLVKYDGIVESTYHRRLQKAHYHLACLLQMEVWFE